MTPVTSHARRRFLQFLAAAPLLSHLRAQQLTKPEDGLSVMDFEAAAKRALPPAHWGYMTSGVDDDLTLKANHEAFQHYRLRARRLVDVSTPDLRAEVFGQTWETPIFICPCGSQRAFHADGELGTARAAKTKQTQMILSTQTSVPIEDVNIAYGKAGLVSALYHLALGRDRKAGQARRKLRISRSWCSPWIGRPGATRKRKPAFAAGHAQLRNLPRRRRTRNFQPAGKPMYAGIDTSGIALVDPALTWTAVDRLKKLTRMKVVLKGISRAKMRSWRGSTAPTGSSCPITEGVQRKAVWLRSIAWPKSWTARVRCR